MWYVAPSYITSHLSKHQRLSLLSQGLDKAAFDSKKPGMMELMERLVALVPRPRVHLTRYHGVLGPHYKYRKQIIPKPPELKVIGKGPIYTK